LFLNILLGIVKKLLLMLDVFHPLFVDLSLLLHELLLPLVEVLLPLLLLQLIVETETCGTGFLLEA